MLQIGTYKQTYQHEASEFLEVLQHRFFWTCVCLILFYVAYN